MFLSVVAVLMACTAIGSTDVNIAERILDAYGGQEEVTERGKGHETQRHGKGHETSSKGKGHSMSRKGKGHELSSKGKGKGGHDGDFDMSLSMSMPLDMSLPMPPHPEGKGSKDSKSSKGAKKSSKASKKDAKKGSKKGGGTDIPSEGGSTAPPAAPSPTTPSPTSANSIPIRATPFALFYEGDFTRIPTDDEFAAVAEVTRGYLEELMIKEFAQTSLTNLDDFVTFMIRNSFDFGEPVQADYRSTGLFNPSSIFLPTVRELNSLINDAFTDDNLDEYVSRVQGLPSGNIFSTTTSVMKGLPDVPVPRVVSNGSSQGSGTFKMGLAAAASGIIVLAAGAAMLKRQRTDEVLEDPYSENLKGDSATLAGETFTTSLDSTAGWRKSSPYVTNIDIDDSEFEDEPLDSDDEHEKRPTKQSRQKSVPPKAAFKS